VPIENGTLRGNEIRFMINQTEYTGRVNGDSMDGIAKGRLTSTWTAKRVAE